MKQLALKPCDKDRTRLNRIKAIHAALKVELHIRHPANEAQERLRVKKAELTEAYIAGKDVTVWFEEHS